MKFATAQAVAVAAVISMMVSASAGQSSAHEPRLGSRLMSRQANQVRQGSNRATNSTARAAPTSGNKTTEAVGPGAIRQVALVNPAPGRCQRRCVRKEVSTLSEEEWVRYANAVRALNRGQGRGGPTPYEVLVQEHLDFANNAHGIMAFLPWHRYYVARFEQSLQQIDPSVCAHYWDWSRVSQDYRSHPVFSARLAGSPRPGCIPDGAFAGWNTRQSGSNCVRREMRTATLAAEPIVVGMMQRSRQSYSTFSTRYEVQVHGAPHVAIGGAKGPMAFMSSPSDPIFWLHHSMVDKNYMEYQDVIRGAPYPNPNEQLVPWGVPVRAMRNVQDWCYTYQQSPLPREQQVRAPTAIPDRWMRMSFGDNDTAISEIKQDSHQVVQEVQGLIDQGKVHELALPDTPLPPIASSSLNLSADMASVLGATLMAMFAAFA